MQLFFWPSLVPFIPPSLNLKPSSHLPSFLLPLYLLTGSPRWGRGERRGRGNACCFLIIIGVFMVILLLIKVLRWMGREGGMAEVMKVQESKGGLQRPPGDK